VTIAAPSSMVEACHASVPAADLFVEEDGLIVIRVKHVDMTAAEMRKVLDARLSLLKARAPLIVDARQVKSMSREAQEMTASAEMRPYTQCIAVLASNPVSVLLVNFFMVLVKPPYPTQMFRDEVKARAWIAETRSRVS
jgi:hypothetical protein